jgi:hypothetical protein
MYKTTFNIRIFLHGEVEQHKESISTFHESFDNLAIIRLTVHYLQVH